MYSNNDFRYYKGGSYLAHYGVKGMKWHKHLKATTDWWTHDVTGSAYKKEANAEADKAIRWGNKASGYRSQADNEANKRFKKQEKRRSEGKTVYYDSPSHHRENGYRSRAKTAESISSAHRNKSNKATYNYYQRSSVGRLKRNVSNGKRKAAEILRKFANHLD